VQNKRGSLFSCLKRFASDVHWPPLREILYRTVQEADIIGAWGEIDTLQLVPACWAQGQDESPYVTVLNHRMTAG
jgi:hypothetical protein